MVFSLWCDVEFRFFKACTTGLSLNNLKFQDRFARCPSDIHSWNWHCNKDDADCEKGVQDISTADNEISGTVH